MPSSILTNALASTSSSSITVVSLVEAVVKGIASGSWTTALGSFFSFIAGAFVGLAISISHASLLIASSLFGIELIRMAAKYVMDHKASDLVQDFAKKLIIWAFIVAFVDNIIPILHSFFYLFLLIGSAAGSSLATHIGSAASAFSNPMTAMTSLYYIIDGVNSLATFTTRVALANIIMNQ